MSPVKSNQNMEAADRFHSAAIHALRHVRREDPASGLSAARLSALSVLAFGGPRTLGELAAAEDLVRRGAADPRERPLAAEERVQAARLAAQDLAELLRAEPERLR